MNFKNHHIMKLELDMTDEFKNEFKKLISEVVKGEILAFGFSEPKKEKPSEYWSRKQVAEFIGCSITTVYHYQRKGILPFVKLGNKVFFNKAVVLKALEGGQL